MSEINVTNANGLQVALLGARGGDVIKLSPGSYSGLTIAHTVFSPPVVITSADLGNMANITDLSVESSKGLTLKGLEFAVPKSSLTINDPKNFIAYKFNHSDSIVIDEVHIHGDPSGTLSNQISGLIFEDSRNITITNSRFDNLHNAINHLRDNYVNIKSNIFFYIYDDAIRGGGTSNITIDSNLFSSLHPDWTDKDHSDCMQFWTKNTTESVRNIVITNNTYKRGRGNTETHGIFMKDTSGNIPFVNVLISKNYFEGANYNGITVDGAVDLTIFENKVVSYPDVRSWIKISNSRNIVFTKNQASKLILENNSHVKDSDNLQISAIRFPPHSEPPQTSLNPSRMIDAMASLGVQNQFWVTSPVNGVPDYWPPLLPGAD